MIRKYQRGNTQIYWGDALEVLSHEITDHSVDLVFADPPYNIGKDFSGFPDRWESEEAYAEWCYSWLDLCIRKLKSSGTLYVMCSTQSMPYLDFFLRKRLHILSRIIWSYDSSGVQAKNYFGSLYEPVLHCVKDRRSYTFNSEDILVEAKTGATRKLIDYRKRTPQPYNTQKVPGNVWYFPRVRYRMSEYENHPSQKPEKLMERIIRASSNPGDTVLDPFSGTFTTCAVGQRLERRTIGVELQEEYIRIGLRRLGILTELNGEPARKPHKVSAIKISSSQMSLFEND
ncbi:MAG: adenine-specific DNA-methyltransferase [Chloroflexota bacterium]|nr:adenine-specific DNA-methyltransferase [Chloroflexota bacterium]MDE2948057.1 adenine-specific DNA-methyltransferase [Chloroflexota bacterium]